MSQLVDKKTKQIRLDEELHRLLKVKAAAQRKTLKEIVEKCLEVWLLQNGQKTNRN